MAARSTRFTSATESRGALERDRDHEGLAAAEHYPGFGITLGLALTYLSLIVLIPLAALVLKTTSLSWEQFWAIATNPRVVAALQVSFGGSLLPHHQRRLWPDRRLGAGAYDFPGRRLLDAIVDLPFALPTAVAGIALTAIFAPTGWIGQFSSRSVSRSPTR